MEMAIAVMGMMGSGSAVAGGAAAAGGLTTAAGGAGMLGMLQGAMTIGSVFASIAGGQAEKADFELQARAQGMQAEREALAIREETLKKIGDSRVAFGASGVTLASSNPVEDTLYGQSSREISLARSGGRINASRSKARGSSAMLAAVTDAMGTAGNYAGSVANRG